MILNQNCQCPEGMYLEQSSYKCKSCAPQCKSCTGQADNCLVCQQNEQTPPSCDWIELIQFRDLNFQCKNPISNTCYTKVYPNKCLTCDENKQCISCKGDRIQSPQCVCLNGSYDDPNNSQYFCQKCQDGFYFDKNQQKCLQCFELCSSCYGQKDKNCVTCSQSLILNNQNECTCSKGRMFVEDNNQKCYKFLKTYFLNHASKDNYELIISFDYPIDKLQEFFTQYGTVKLFQINISEVNQTFYKIQNYEISSDNKQIIFFLNIFQNIQKTFGFLIFKNTSLFINQKQKYILDPDFGRIPFQFSIGPYFLKTDTQIPISQIIPQDKNFVSAVSKFQVLLYIQNSVQPTSMFLLLNLQLPPNLQQFLSQFGKYVFRNVPSTQSEKVQNKFDVCGFDANNEVQDTSQVHLARLGFSNSIMINCQFIILKYFTILMLNLIIFTIQLSSNSQKFNSIYEFLIKRISIENEINLLMIIVSIYAQFKEINQNSYIQRWDFYLAVVIAFIYIYSSSWFYRLYNSTEFEQNKNILEEFYVNLKDYDKLNKHFTKKNKHFLNTFKKLMILSEILILQDYPLTLCDRGFIQDRMFEKQFLFYI
ncbi:hypothetical protein ABPG72_018595 [Tetrahymena utriculariae]